MNTGRGGHDSAAASAADDEDELTSSQRSYEDKRQLDDDPDSRKRQKVGHSIAEETPAARALPLGLTDGQAMGQYNATLRLDGGLLSRAPHGETTYNPVTTNRGSPEGEELLRQLIELSCTTSQIDSPSIADELAPYLRFPLSTIQSQPRPHQSLALPSSYLGPDLPYSILSSRQRYGVGTNLFQSPLEVYLASVAQASIQQAALQNFLLSAAMVQAQQDGNDARRLPRPCIPLQQDTALSSVGLASADPRNRRNKCNSHVSGLTLYVPEDRVKLNEHQVFLRLQIEYFAATQDDILSITRGKNKPIVLQQVGIRCRHCCHLPAGRRNKASTYFPSTLMGIYQSAQNLGVEHLQSGVCPRVPRAIVERFSLLASSKSVVSGAGKKYWADKAAMLGLVDTENGIRFAADLSQAVKGFNVGT